MEQRKSRVWKVKGTEIDFKKDKISNTNLADYVVNMKKDNITYDFIMGTFGYFNGVTLCNPYDLLMVLPNTFYFEDMKGKIKSNTNEFTTSVGLYIFNILLRDFKFSKFFGYVSQTIDKKMIGKIDKRLVYAIVEDDITTSAYKEWQDTLQWMMPFETILSPNHTEKMITCSKVIRKKKAELLKKYAKEIEAGDIKVVENIEKELLIFAQEYMGDDPSMDTILSGGGGDLKNNFKNMYVMKGAVKNPDPNSTKAYDIVTSNYIDGISADEYSIIARSGVAGAYSRGKKTETGGYWEKLFVSGYQHIRLDPPGSDCGTDKYITVDLTDNNIDDFMYSYVIKGNGLELINTETRDSYIGKTVKMRFASMCKSKTGICNKCAGELFYALQANNIGATMAQIPSTLKLKCMKSFHDSTVKTTQIDPMKAFYPYGN